MIPDQITAKCSDCFFFLIDVVVSDCPCFQIVESGDTNHDGVLDFEEFTEYLRTNEKQLKLMFSSLDKNNDGLHQSLIILFSFFILGLF